MNCRCGHALDTVGRCPYHGLPEDRTPRTVDVLSRRLERAGRREQQLVREKKRLERRVADLENQLAFLR